MRRGTMAKLVYGMNQSLDGIDEGEQLHLERGEIVFDADYVRGRMMKTRIVIGSNGRFTVETGNRHEMALRWLDRLRGKKHIRLVAERSAGQTAGRPTEGTPRRWAVLRSRFANGECHARDSGRGDRQLTV